MTADNGGRQDGSGGARVRTLIVDDYPLMTDLLTALLDSLEGVKVVGHALDGVEALEKVDALNVDLVILDAEMPRMSGLEAIPLLKAKHPGIRIVLMDLHDDATHRGEALDAGADAYCDKLQLQEQLPVMIHDLFPT